MSMLSARFIIFLLYATGLSDQAAFRCGVERWSIKTGTDTAAALISTASPTPTTIAHLVGLPAPHPIPKPLVSPVLRPRRG